MGEGSGCPRRGDIVARLASAADDAARRHLFGCAECQREVESSRTAETRAATPIAAQGGDPDATVRSGPRRDPIESAELPRGTPVGRYLVLETIGIGGMGVVYSAFDPELNRTVALKLV